MQTSSIASNAALLLARIALAALFLIEAAVKYSAWAPSQAYMQKFGVPGELLPAAIALELGAGLAILLGWQARFAASALALFCVVTAAIFHNKLSDQGQALHFWKDIAIAGGFLALAAAGSGSWSIDAILRRRRTAVTA